MTVNPSAAVAPPSWRKTKWVASLAVALGLWAALYSQLVPFSRWAVGALSIDPHSRIGEAIAFFLYDAPKVLLLLTLVVFAMGIVRSFFSAERTRALLAGRREGVGNVLAACLGIVTPFCSCSAVPLFIGFVSAGVPLGVTFSFLIAAPMINEVALGLLFGLLGWKVALTYLFFGLAVAIVAGWVIGRLHLEHWLEEWVRNVRSGSAEIPSARLDVVDRIRAGLDAVRDIVGRVWPWMLAGIAAGALIHGYAPAETLAAVLAFMMSVIALSLPEIIILRKVLTLRLIAVFVGVVGAGILAVGFLFNALFN